MARVTIEDSLKKGYNKFMIVHLAAKRVIQLK
jgi:DNA-directed RNA polymerase omega subunit